jgi:hypothetical protein
VVPSLLPVSVPVVICTEELQVFYRGYAACPDWLNMIDLKIGFGTTDSSCSFIFMLAALISVFNMLSHGDY